MPDGQYDRRSATSSHALRRILVRLAALGGLVAGLWLLGALFGSAAQASAVHTTRAVTHSSNRARHVPAARAVNSQNRFAAQDIRSVVEAAGQPTGPDAAPLPAVIVRDATARGMGRVMSQVAASSSRLVSTVRRSVPVEVRTLTRDVRSTVSRAVRAVVATAARPLRTVVTGVSESVRPTLGRVVGGVSEGVPGTVTPQSAAGPDTRAGAALPTAGCTTMTCAAAVESSSAQRSRCLASPSAAGRTHSPARATVPGTAGPSAPAPANLIPAGATAGSAHTSSASSDLVATSRAAGRGRHTASFRRDATVRKQPAPRPSFAPD